MAQKKKMFLPPSSTQLYQAAQRPVPLEQTVFSGNKQ